MHRSNSLNLYIESDGNIHKFINCKLEPNDGSFYITLQRDGKNSETTTYNSRDELIKKIVHDQPRDKKVRISYHTSGCVLYRYTEISANYFEPMPEISQINVIVAWSIPAINKLDKVEEIKADDLVISIKESNKRIEFTLILAAWNQEIQGNHLAVRYEGLFCFIVTVAHPNLTIPQQLDEQFITAAPGEVPFKIQVIENDQALVNFHQKLNSTSDLIIYSPNKEGIYKIITAVPMRIAPAVKIEFFENDYKAEILSCKNHVIKFKVKNVHGHTVKEKVKIKGIELDSRY